jgi:hypothetical protein
MPSHFDNVSQNERDLSLMSDKGVVMATYFETLEQAEKHIQGKKNMESSKIAWCILECHIGFLVLSEAQAHQCFPDLIQGNHGYLTKIK